MNEASDSELLRAYAEQRSDPAFAELVRRHINLVYSVALRVVGDSHQAQDVVQGVFVLLAKKSHEVKNHEFLAGWLHRAAQNIAAQTVRGEIRRRARENEAAVRQHLQGAAEDAAWEDIAPHLDAALGKLNETDRDALLLRYFERKSSREIAQVFGISDEAAQKRATRALERLRDLFICRGVVMGAGGLATCLAANSVQAAPAGLTATIASTALAQASGIGAGAKLMVGVSKLTSLKALLSSLPGAAVIPVTLTNWVVMRLDLGNFRDREGFRARLFRRSSWWWILFIALWMLGLRTLDSRLGGRFGFEKICLVGMAAFLLASAAMARRLTIMRTRYFVSLVAANALTALCFLAVGLDWLPFTSVLYSIIGIAVLQVIFYGERPLRSDYNLFLRAAENLLPAGAAALASQPAAFRGSSKELFRFARFLGGRWLVNDFRRKSEDLILFLTPVNVTVWRLSWNLGYLDFWSPRSEITLWNDGTVSAHLTGREAKVLARTRPRVLTEKSELETTVAAAVQSAWHSFRDGDVDAAERALGQTSEADVFLTPTRKSLSTRLQRGFMIGVAIVLVAQAIFINRILKTLNLSVGSMGQMEEQELKRAMSDLKNATNAEKRFYALGDAAKESFIAGKIQNARDYALELKGLTPKFKTDWNYGNAVQDANLVLGRIAVQDGDIASAKNYLLAAGTSPGSPQMNSFGPNMSLAKDLLEKGERQVVLQYFAGCRKFWKMHRGRLDDWSEEVEAGKIPDFGANLVY